MPPVGQAITVLRAYKPWQVNGYSTGPLLFPFEDKTLDGLPSRFIDKEVS